MECPLGQNCHSGFCIDGSIRAWNLEISETDYNTLIDNPYEDIFVPCVLVADEVRYDQGCKVRLRGGSARDYPKKSFRITFDEDVAHPGFQRKINLRAEYNELSFLRNVVALETFRRLTQVPTPRTRFIDFSINGVLYGLMSEVERVGGKLLRESGRDDTKALYEADPPLELFGSGVGALVPLPEEALYRASFEKKSPADPSYADLITFIEETIWGDFEDGETRQIRAEVDVELYLQYLALMGLVQNHDHIRKNYYLTRQLHPAGSERWEVLPWDLDLSLGCLYDDVLMTTYCEELITNEAPDRGILVGAEAGYPVMAFYNQLQHDVLSDPEMRARFEELLCQMTSGPWWTDGVTRFIAAKETEIHDLVEADERDRNVDVFAFEAEVADLSRFVTQRAAFVRSALACP
jgi:spore coat protein CotH